jgi:natural product precursor
MAKIKIKDLPKNAKISKSEMKNVKGGLYLRSSYGRIGTFSPSRLTKSVNIVPTSPFSMDISCW